MKLYFNLILLLCIAQFSVGQSYWQEMKESDLITREQSVFNEMPEKYKLFTLEFESFQNQLKNAPMIDETFENQKYSEMVLPVITGKTETFLIFEQPVMESELSAKYPMLKSYKGVSKSNPDTKIWFTTSPYGFSGAMSTEEGIVYIDPFFENGKEIYLVYDVDTYKNNPYGNIPLCGVDEISKENGQPFMPFSRNSIEVEMRTYRLAMACTGEWGRLRGTVQKCLSDMNIMVTRLTQIYESEVAIRFVLVDDNDKVIFLDPDTDPYFGSDMAKTILPTNTGILNERIGANNYDVGHVLSICFDVGGVAALGSACQSNKGNGVTCFNNNNFEYAVASIMAHEVGHQFDASHTFNSCAPSQENVSAGTAYEPGSGSTIMSYGGLCGVDNIFSGSDAYFHVASLEQILGKTTPGGNAYNCAQKTPSGNMTPEITMPPGGFTIPISTPFELTASATDVDGDNLTYRWEQYDLGPQSTLGSPIGNAPLFRSFWGTSSPTRFFPEKSRIFKNQLNARDEVLPTITRDLTFKCVVKDQKPAGVGVVWDEVSFNVTADAGPFVITYPKLDAKFDIGNEVTVTWDVANTNQAPVNCKKVNIYVSYNEALLNNDPNLVLVAKEVPNNGSRKIIVPNRLSNKVNFVIKAADNIFLTTSVLPTIVSNPTSPGIFVGVDDDYRIICLPSTADFVFSTAGLSGLNENIQFEIVGGLPAGAVATFSNTSVVPGETTTLSLDMTNVSGKGIAEIAVRAFVPGVDTLIRYLRVDYTATDLNNVNLVTPDNGTTGGSVLPVFGWSDKPDATTYQFQLALNPSFSAPSLVLERELAPNGFTSSVILDKAKIYYWRVRGVNECKIGEWSEIYAFSTEVLSCQSFKSGELAINISSSGRPTVETVLNVPFDGELNDLNISLIRVDHQRNGDLIASLISPSNTEIILWSKKCGTQKNIVLGLDDESPTFFGCPLNNGRTMKPDIKLSGFNGEATKGNWILRIKDDEPGEGGRLLEFNMEICSNVAVAAPSLIINEILQIPPGDKPSLKQTYLLVSDEDNTAEQLTFTLVSAPTHGVLTLNGNELIVGSTFTQDDINNDRVRYTHDGSDFPTDNFTFTVIDGQGGWIPITTFEIEIDESFPSDSRDVEVSYDIKLFPNPVNDQDLYVVVGDHKVVFTDYIIFDATGRKCIQGKMKDNQTSVNVTGWMSGLYTVQLFNKNTTTLSSFIKS